jgi:subtilisin family serine protease
MAPGTRLGVSAAPGGPPARPDVVPGQYIIVFHDWVADPATEALVVANEHGLGILHTYGSALKGFAATVPAARLALLQQDARVDFVSEDRVVEITAQTLPTGVNRIEGDTSSTVSGSGSGSVNVAVAIIDTGVDIDHPDLNVVGGRNCSTGRSYDDGNGHGTHVAGTVAAKDNTTGVVGVAPGAPLYAVRVLNNAGSGSWSSVICGVDWVTANAVSKGIKVANMSLGGSGSDSSSDANCNNANNDALHKAICNSVKAGVTYVVAAGNSNTDFKGFVPAAYDEVLTVTAVADFNGQSGGGAAATCRSDVDDTAADFSNFATLASDQAHTIAAPGVCILSSWKGGEYNTISGTSMASPHGAGVAALCIAGPCAGMTPAEVRARLRNDASAQPANYGFDGDPNEPIGSRYYGYLVYAGGY